MNCVVGWQKYPCLQVLVGKIRHGYRTGS